MNLVKFGGLCDLIQRKSNDPYKIKVSIIVFCFVKLIVYYYKMLRTTAVCVPIWHNGTLSILSLINYKIQIRR